MCSHVFPHLPRFAILPLIFPKDVIHPCFSHVSPIYSHDLECISVFVPCFMVFSSPRSPRVSNALHLEMKDKKFIDKLQIAECWFSLGALQAGTPLGKKFLDPADYNIYIYCV